MIFVRHWAPMERAVRTNRAFISLLAPLPLAINSSGCDKQIGRFLCQLGATICCWKRAKGPSLMLRAWWCVKRQMFAWVL
ncbi:hypothetical protein BaRGS_00032477 [Batillaria attramentaria]|uniref:Secreted protein n=1 Tax=Batillaria attramentaria TaxID=370345 RepID=A0ABD0JMP8_9CAEN